MGKQQNNPLANLNLGGLDILNQKISDKGNEDIKLRAQPVDTPDLGILSKLSGTWTGTGFNIIEVPNRNMDKSIPLPAAPFKVIVNATSETLTFSPIGGDIINRGNAQNDIAFLGLHYLQQIDDVNLPHGQNGIHLETGLFLNLPNGTDPAVQPSVARLGSVPHGDSLLAQGSFITFNGKPTFGVADPTPFSIVDGKRHNDSDATYLAIISDTVLPPGIPKEVLTNPNIMLENAISGQDIIQTEVIFLDANPIDGVANTNAVAPTGGITNIPFVNVNANATSLSAIFWIETVRNPDGTTFLQLQYTQTVILDFPVRDAQGQVFERQWPHISVATLRLVPVS